MFVLARAGDDRGAGALRELDGERAYAAAGCLDPDALTGGEPPEQKEQVVGGQPLDAEEDSRGHLCARGDQNISAEAHRNRTCPGHRRVPHNGFEDRGRRQPTKRFHARK